MKHYPHHIGDFNRDTRHLSRLERSIYRDLMDLYYDTEEQLPLDLQRLCKRILANSNEESTAVERLLNEYFDKTEGGWFNGRCNSVIEAYHSNSSQKALAGRASVAARALKRQQALNGNSTHVEQPLNRRSTEIQLTSKPVNQKKEGKAQALAPAIEIPETLLADFLAVRKAKNSGPLTDTAIKGLIREAGIAGITLTEAVTVCVEAGWVGFSANWYTRRINQTGKLSESNRPTLRVCI